MGLPLRPQPDHDERLITRLRNGDERAYEVLFTEHAGPLYEYACRVAPTRAEAEELVHDVFLAVWARRTVWNPRPPIRAYLVRAVRNRVLNVLRHERVVDRWARTMSAGETHSAPGADSEVEDAEQVAAVAGAMRQLPARAREAVELRYAERLTFAEIAERLAISPRTAENHVARALKRLRALLGGRRDR